MTAEHLQIAQPEPDPVLRASIAASEHRAYSVSLHLVGDAVPAEQRYLRFALHYYARVLYELVRSGRSVRDLPALIGRIANDPEAWRGNLFVAAGVRGMVTKDVQHPIGEVVVVLRRAGFRDFEVDGDFGLTGRALALSVIAVLQSILPRVSPDAAGAILAALSNMNVSYTMTHAYRDPRSYREVPTIAYHAAAFI
jgi:hypothetical protein